MSFIGIGCPIPEIANLPGQGGAIEVLLDYSSAAVCNDATTQSPSQAEPSGGVFSASPSGLNINTSTGVITPVGSTPATYTITYTVSGESSSFTFTINPVQQSTFSYSSSSLEQYGTASPIFASGTTTGGTFSATSGLVINTTTGVLDLANSTIGGPYTVTYTTPGPCATSSTFNVSVTALSTSLVDNNFALSFDGNDQLVDAGFISALSQSSSYTISMWIKPDSVPSTTQAIFSLYSNSNNRIEMYPGSSGTITFVNSNGGLSATAAAFPSPAPSNGWYHVALVYDGTFTDSDPVVQNQGRIKPYINTVYTAAGVSGTQQAQTPNFTGKRATIGARSINYATPTLDFIGDIDEVAIWSRALDATDIQRIYNGSSTSGKAANLFSTGLSNGLVYWNRMGD